MPPIPIDEAPERPSNVINLMDALRKSVAADVRAKKPVKSEKAPPAAKKLGVVKAAPKAASKRKSA